MNKHYKKSAMRKFLVLVAWFIVILSVVMIYKRQYCEIPESEKTSFSGWYKKYKRSSGNNPVIEHSYKVESPYFEVDTIYRSMQGPFASKEFYLSENFFDRLLESFNPKLLWITGYKVELFDERGNRTSDEFMCHNNINLGSKNILPWHTRTLGTDKRLFTLSEGQTNQHLPPGFGIPVLSNQSLRVDFQVLNHNLKDTSLKIKQVVTIFFVVDDLRANMKALYQQAVFVTKHISGPKGNYNEPVAGTDSDLLVVKPSQPCCNRVLYDSSVYNPFRDRYNREFTGHWVIPDSIEELKTGVSEMLNLESDQRAYFFSSHVHPFCERLELIDESSNELVYSAEIHNFRNKIGISNIPYGSSLTGIKLFKNHLYTLKSRYHKKDSEKHTAMATMFVYLEEL